MSYDFSFDKKTIILMAIGSVAIGVLLFLAGFIVGLDRSSGQAEAATKHSPQSGAETKPSAQLADHPTPALSKPSPDKAKESSSPASADSSKALASQQEPKSSEAASKEKAEDTKDQPAFSLQLGAFQAEDNALKLRDNLKAKGYPVFLFRVLDAEGHVWHTVRMGQYTDMKKASQAAAVFSSKEQTSAWVRPSNAF